MRLMGIPVSDLDCEVLIDSLLQVGRVEDLVLAARIDQALETDAYLLGLSPAERDQLLGVLYNPPETLVHLRDVLDRDRRGRARRFASPLTGMTTTMATEIDSVPYLVHYPDNKQAVHNIEIGRVAEVGTEILDGWVVDEIKQIDEMIDDKPVTYEVWVRPRLTH